MKRARSFIVIFVVFATVHVVFGQDNAADFFETADQFFTENVKNARVDYRSIRKQPAALHDLVERISAFNLDELPKGDAQKAFWINAYNILVIKGIVEHWPTDSPLKIAGFFDEIKYAVAGEELTLNNIEHDKIRAAYNDARIHFVLVCAAAGCPALIPTAYLPGTLKQQLDARTRASLSDTLHVRVDAAQKKVFVSELFKWYRDDFLAEEPSILAYINLFRDTPIPLHFSIDFTPYDWQLNAVRQ